MSEAKCKQDEVVRRPYSFSRNDAVVDIQEKMSSNRAEPCDEEVPTGRSTNLQSINLRPSALKTVEDDGSKQIEVFLCQELEEKEAIPNILGCSAGWRDAEPGTPCSGSGPMFRLRRVRRRTRNPMFRLRRERRQTRNPGWFEAVDDILETLPSRANRAEPCYEEVPTGRSSNLQSINQRRSAEQAVEDDGFKQIERILCEELEEQKMMPDILECSAGWSDAESGIPCFSGNDAVVDILEKLPSGANRAESCSQEVPTNLRSINQRLSAGQTMDGSFLFPRRAGIRVMKGHNRFNGLDNEYAPGTSCEKKPVASHCTCLHKKHEASSSDSSSIEHHMPPIPEGSTTKQDKAGRVESWAILLLSDIGAKHATRFVCEVKNACARIQMDIKELPLTTAYLGCAFPDGIENSVLDEYKLINTFVPRGKQLGLLIIVLPDVRDFDEKVEAVCKNLGVVYHCCLPQDVLNLNEQYLKIMACEINAKVLKRNSCCDYCKNIGLDGSSIEFCVLDEEFDDYVSISDEDVSLNTDSDEVYGFDNEMEGDDGSEQSDELGEIDTCYEEPRESEASELLNVSHEHMTEADGFKLNIQPSFEENGEPLPESCSESNDLDLVEVEQGITIHWACISYSIMDSRHLLRFFSKLHAVSVANGMHFNPMPIKIELVGSAITAETLSKTWYKLCKSASKLFTRNGIKGAQIEFVFVILPECRDSDEEVEKFFNKLGVVYQLCLPDTIRIPTNRHLKKFARQLKFKVSKRGMVIPFVSEAPTILFGADISHCEPEEGSRSVASVVASLDWPKVSKYGALVASQPHDEVIIRDLFNEHHGGMVSKLLLIFCLRAGLPGAGPSRIIFFRHGITEGQQSHICEQEINAIRKDCILSGYVQTTLTYVVVTQRLNMEFEGSSNMTKKRLRVQQDTSYPTKFEVLCDHGPFEGTNMVVHYRVVHDENNLTAQELESMIIRLSLVRDCQMYPEISMIPPAHFAHLAARYYQRHFDSRKGEGSCDVELPSLGGLEIFI